MLTLHLRHAKATSVLTKLSTHQRAQRLRLKCRAAKITVKLNDDPRVLEKHVCLQSASLSSFLTHLVGLSKKVTFSHSYRYARAVELQHSQALIVRRTSWHLMYALIVRRMSGHLLVV